jgi:hypothetical protein
MWFRDILQSLQYNLWLIMIFWEFGLNANLIFREDSRYQSSPHSVLNNILKLDQQISLNGIKNTSWRLAFVT